MKLLATTAPVTEFLIPIQYAMTDEHSLFQAHRIVLSSCSPYFRAMFTSDLAESRQEKIILYDVDPGAVESLIDYAYTNKVVCLAIFPC